MVTQLVSLVSDVGAIVAAGMFGVGLGVGIIAGAEILRIIHRPAK